MTADVEVVQVEECPTAVRRAHATMATLPETIGRLLDPVWAFLRASDLVTNHNIVLYEGDLGDDGANIEVGVQVDRPFEGAPDGIVASELPAALVARAVHQGPYNRIGETHAAVLAWCEANGFRPMGTSWEIYGDWTDDPDALETEVVHAVESMS